MTPVEALKLALSQEDNALTLYQKLSLEHPSLKDTFSFLMNEEQRHKKLLHDKIAELTRY